MSASIRKLEELYFKDFFSGEAAGNLRKLAWLHEKFADNHGRFWVMTWAKELLANYPLHSEKIWGLLKKTWRRSRSASELFHVISALKVVLPGREKLAPKFVGIAGEALRRNQSGHALMTSISRAISGRRAVPHEECFTLASKAMAGGQNAEDAVDAFAKALREKHALAAVKKVVDAAFENRLGVVQALENYVEVMQPE